eukprot:364736-Chlamydomonas_euryale.AAC.2
MRWLRQRRRLQDLRRRHLDGSHGEAAPGQQRRGVRAHEGGAPPPVQGPFISGTVSGIHNLVCVDAVHWQCNICL